MRNVYILLFVVLTQLATYAADSNTVKLTVIDSSKKATTQQQDVLDSVKTDTASTNDINVLERLSIDESKKEGLNVLSDIFSISNIIWAIIIFVLAYFILKTVKKLLEYLAEKSAALRITIKGLIPIITILGWTIVIYVVIVGVFNPPSDTLLAALASTGIAFGFAAQDVLKNIFAGIVIIFDSPFKVGDKIEIGNHYGEVLNIGLRSTRIVTADDSMVVIPNSEVMNTSVSNSNTGEPNCQVVAEIYLPPSIDSRRVRQIATEAAQVSKYIYLNKPITVLFFNEVKDRRPYLKMRLKAYVLDIRSEFAFKSDMTELVMEQLYKEGILDKSYFLS